VGNDKETHAVNEAAIQGNDRPELTLEDANESKADLEDLETARQAKLADIPARQRAIFRRAWTGKSRKAAIRAFCLECMGYQSAEINRCTGATCPLYPYREDRL